MELLGWGFIIEKALEVGVTLLFLLIGLTTWRGYQRTKNPNLRSLSAVFIPAAFIYLTLEVLKTLEMLGVGAYHAIFHNALLVIVLGILAWTIRWQPTWRMPLKRKETH